MAGGQTGLSPSLSLLCLQMPSCPGRQILGRLWQVVAPPLLSQAAPDDVRPEWVSQVKQGQPPPHRCGFTTLREMTGGRHSAS